MPLIRAFWIGSLALGQLTASTWTLCQRMTSPEWKTRRDAFYQLIWLGDPAADHETARFPGAVKALCSQHPGEADAIRRSLIELLEHENSVGGGFARRGGNFGEDFSDYYGDVIGTVSGLNDQAAIPALLGALDTGGMAQRGLARFGPTALPQVLSLLHDTGANGTRRAGAVWVLHDMLTPPYGGKMIDPSVRARMDDELLSSATDADFAVRLAAVTALGDTGDPRAIPVLRWLEANDPVRLTGEANNGGDLYPVRLAAERALLKLGHKNQR